MHRQTAHHTVHIANIKYLWPERLQPQTWPPLQTPTVLRVPGRLQACWGEASHSVFFKDQSIPSDAGSLSLTSATLCLSAPKVYQKRASTRTEAVRGHPPAPVGRAAWPSEHRECPLKASLGFSVPFRYYTLSLP